MGGRWQNLPFFQLFLQKLILGPKVCLKRFFMRSFKKLHFETNYVSLILKNDLKLMGSCGRIGIPKNLVLGVNRCLTLL